MPPMSGEGLVASATKKEDAPPKVDEAPVANTDTFKFNVGAYAAKEFVFEEMPRRIVGKIINRQAVPRLGNTYVIKPVGFELITVDAAESQLIAVEIIEQGGGLVPTPAAEGKQTRGPKEVRKK